MKLPRKRPSVLPGFGLTMGFTVLYLSVLVLIPLAALVLKTTGTTWEHFRESVTTPEAMASYRLSLGASLVAASINGVFGFLVAWVLVRYRFAFRKIFDAMVDLPFALPTAVSGITLTKLYDQEGWIGRWTEAAGVQVAYTWIGVTVALTFIGLPFVVRTLQPALEDLDAELEEAAASLGASRWQTFRHVIFPTVLPALLTGFAMALARALGEYGSVIFIAGNIPLETQITPLLIVAKRDSDDLAGAASIAVVMLAASFLMLLAINLLQRWSRRRFAEVI